MTDLTERLQRYVRIRREKPLPQLGDSIHCVHTGTEHEAELRLSDLTAGVSLLETLTQEVERLRGLLIDPGDPAWEDARAVLVAELRKAGMDTHADNVAEGHALQIPSWIALNLIAHSRKSLTQENARLREAGWRDIESAPRDGTQFLALVSNGWYALVRAPAKALQEGWPYQWWVTSDRQSYPVVDTHSADSSFGMTLEYWMPLPPAPARKALGGGDE